LSKENLIENENHLGEGSEAWGHREKSALHNDM